MTAAFRTVGALALGEVRLERVAQDGSGPFERAHRLAMPALVHVPVPAQGAALGRFGASRYTALGPAVLVPADLPLHVRSPGFGAREMIVLRFDPARFAAMTGLGADASVAELAACADVRAPGLLATLDRLAAELARPGIGQEAIVAGLGLIALGELARHFARVRQADTARGMLADWQLRRIEARLAEAGAPPDVGTLAALCGIGRRHLMRAYKARTGETVMARVDRARFARAVALLDAGLPVKAIAGALGYECQGSFATAFRRRFGVAPSGWRRNG